MENKSKNSLNTERGVSQWTVSAIIPTCDAGEERIAALLRQLETQTRKPDEILVVDSASKDGTAETARAFSGVRVSVVPRERFDHGGTRDFALRETAGDVVFFFTQDVELRDERLVERMLAALSQPFVACAYGRQAARADAPLYERLTREFNYPDGSFVRHQDDIPRFGVKAFFFSDVCSAYRRDAYLAVGGFDAPVRTNEDMLIAAKFLHAGYRTAYCAEAVVTHSHRFTPAQEYRRYLSIGRVLWQYRRRLNGAGASGEGMRMAAFVFGGLLRRGAFGQCAAFLPLCAAKWIGIRAGMRIQKKLEALGASGNDCRPNDRRTNV